MDHSAGAADLDRFAPETEGAEMDRTTGDSLHPPLPLPAAISRDFDRSRFWSDG